jgi:hypothetical protein
MLPVIVSPLRKGICCFIMILKLQSNYYYYIRCKMVYYIMSELKISNYNLQI